MRLNRVRTFATTLTLAALVAVSATACKSDATVQGGGSSVPPVTTEKQGDPKAAVSVAAEKTNQQSFRMTLTMDPEMSMEGVVDPVTKTGHSTMSMQGSGFSMQSESIIIGDDVYVKVSGGALGSDKWTHMSTKKLGDTFGASQQLDPTQFLDKATDVVQVDALTYTGVIDASALNSKTFGGDNPVADKLKAIPFKLTLDDQGRLARMEMTMKGLSQDGTDRTMVTTISDYGVPVDVTAPPADQVEEAPFGN